MKLKHIKVANSDTNQLALFVPHKILANYFLAGYNGVRFSNELESY
ncbi:hypothetical protein PLUTE_a5253 [Pseudoalteromonas luteoviolacea DSM 6061]|nr:hypothetical protein [Pseudoalteromonas luteoviolacea DSM 6061]